MSETLHEPHVRSDERLLLTIVIAAALHAMVVLGVRFTPDAPVKSRFAAMQVVLVPPPAASTMAVEAGAHSDHDEQGSDEPPLAPMAPVEKPVIKAAPAPREMPAARAPAGRREASTPVTPTVTHPPPGAAPTTTTEPTASLPAASSAPLPSAAQLIARSMEFAAGGAGLIEDKTVNGQSQSERTLYVKRNTRDFTQAAYLDGLLRKIKAFGQLFQRDVPPGAVELDVAINADGSLSAATITQSSGIDATDAEAVRVLRQAAPFAPLPPAMAKANDLVHFEFTMNLTKGEGN